jgi:hypothetical protein
MDKPLLLCVFMVLGFRWVKKGKVKKMNGGGAPTHHYIKSQAKMASVLVAPPLR